MREYNTKTPKDIDQKLIEILLFIGILVLFFSSSLIQIIPIKFFHLDIKKITASQNVLLTVFSNSVLSLILILIFRKDLKEDFANFKKNYKEILDLAFRIWVVGLVLMAISNYAIGLINTNNISNNETAIREMIRNNRIASFLNTALLAPIVEELVFRKSFRLVFKNDIAFVIISGFIFGALHVVLSINNAYDFLFLIPYCSLGTAFSYMYYKTKNIFGPLSMHMMHNAIITLLNIFLVGIILW